jgi:hypothetical protein
LLRVAVQHVLLAFADLYGAEAQKPPSFAASAAACAVASSHCLKAADSSAVALELTMAVTR